jgi:protein O-GlcNAc transferase
LSAEKPRQSKKKRVGIVSAHIFEHSVWRAFVRGWVEHLDRRKVELHIFYVGGVMDAETEWAKKQIAHFHHGLPNWRDWAHEIRNAQLDTLIYPEIGMDATTLRLAALRLAPTQMVGWGHPITSGLPTMDAYISAEAFEPPDSDVHYSEKLISLGGVGACYRPYKLKIPACDVKQMGLHPDDVVFICAGMPMKYSPKYDPVFIEISRSCEQSKLIFFKKDGDPFFEKFENRLRDAYRSGGLDFDSHVRFVSWLSRPEFFALLQRADIYLDSMGFSGFNTAMQALECDLPIVAYEGDAMRGRFASGLLRTIGLHEWVASNPAEFVEMAGRLAQDSASRQAYKRKIASHKSRLMHDASSVHELCEIINQ